MARTTAWNKQSPNKLAYEVVVTGILSAALLTWGAAVAMIDWRSRRIPNSLVMLALIPELVSLVIRGEGLLGHGFLVGLSGAAIGLAVFLPGFLLRASGGGDVKLAACCGLILGGVGSLVMLLVAALTMGMASLVVVLRHRGRGGRDVRLPAGPALIAGFAVALLFGWMKVAP